MTREKVVQLGGGRHPDHTTNRPGEKKPLLRKKKENHAFPKKKQLLPHLASKEINFKSWEKTDVLLFREWQEGKKGINLSLPEKGLPFQVGGSVSLFRKPHHQPEKEPSYISHRKGRLPFGVRGGQRYFVGEGGVS